MAKAPGTGVLRIVGTRAISLARLRGLPASTAGLHQHAVGLSVVGAGNSVAVLPGAGLPPSASNGALA